MNLNEAKKRMVYQIESTNQGTALNEIYMTCTEHRSDGRGYSGAGGWRRYRRSDRGRDR